MVANSPQWRGGRGQSELDTADGEGAARSLLAAKWRFWFGELDEPDTQGQLLVRALDPGLVWLAHEREPWRPRAV